MRYAISTFLLLSGSAIAGQGAWSSGGPYGGNIYRLEADYSTPGRMYAMAQGGLFRKAGNTQPWVAMTEGLLSSPYVSGPLVLDRDGNENLFVFDGAGRFYRSEQFTDPYAPPGQNTRVVWRHTGYTLPEDLIPNDLAEAPGSSSVLFLAVRDNDPNTPTSQALLYRSTDTGATFAPVPGIPADKAVNVVAIDPANANHILVGLQSYELATPVPSPPTIWESTDGGASFHASALAVVPTTTFAPNAGDIVFAPGGRSYAVVNNRIHVSLSNGATGSWTETTGVLQSVGASGTLRVCGRDQYLFASPGDSNVVYSIGTGISKWTLGSTSGAAPWPISFVAVNEQLTANPTLSGTLGANVGLPLPAQICTLTASTTNHPTSGFLIAATFGAGALRTTSNANNTWTRLNSGTDINNGLGGVNIRAVAFHPSNVDTVLAGLGDNFYGSPGIFASSDSAVTWSESNDGLKASNVRHIVFDATTTAGGAGTAIVYAAGRTASSPFGTLSDPGYRSAGVFKSTTGGATWSSLSGNLPSGATSSLQYIRNVRWIALDPRSCGSPPFPTTGSPCASGVPGGLKRFYATADGFSASFSADPEFPGLEGQEFTHRIVRTDDGGTSYTALDTPANGFPRSLYVYDPNAGLDVMYRTITPYLVLIDPNDSQRLMVPTFATLEDYDGPGGYSPDIATGVYCSSNAGTSWAPCNGTGTNQLPLKTGFGLARQDILSAVMHPVNGQIVWVTTYDFNFSTGQLIAGGVYRTTDGGANWTRVSNGLPARVDLRSLIIDPEDPQIVNGNADDVTLYASSTGTTAQPGGVYRSDDGGLNWRSISVGLPAASATALAVDPSDRRRIMAGTDFGVWEITQLTDTDGDGIPNSEEGQSNGGDGNGDGQQDSLQKDVGTIGVSIRTPAGGTANLPTTSDVIEAQSTATIPGGCTQTEDVQSIPSITYGQDLAGSGNRRYFYPRNLWRIQINDCAHAVVDITYHGADFVNEYGWSFRYFGPQTPGDDTSVGWYAFASRAHLVAPTINKWRVTLDANQFGSYRSDTDRILFVGGPACYDDRVMKNGFESSEVPALACGS